MDLLDRAIQPLQIASAVKDDMGVPLGELNSYGLSYSA
jgi:hypothetical protein